MKNLIVLYAGDENCHQFDCIFAGKSAFSKALDWAVSTDDVCAIAVFEKTSLDAYVQKEIKDFNNDKKLQISVIKEDVWTVRKLLSSVSKISKQCEASQILYAWADQPFINRSLTAELIDTHTKYFAEYTFADGYPLCISPEIINSDALALLSNIAASNENVVERDSIFSVMKGDINSFEIENVLSEKDYRHLRLHFSCDTKLNTLACQKLFEILSDVENACDIPAEKFSDIASENANVLQTVPAFYGIQITQKCTSDDVYTPYYTLFKNKYGLSPVAFVDKCIDMPLDKFEKIVKQISDLSEKAVVSLSAYGEPLLHPAFLDMVKIIASHSGLSLLIETSGVLVTDEIAKSVKNIAGDMKVMWIVSIDSVTSDMYCAIHQNCKSGDFEKSVAAVRILNQYFSKDVYPQFLRINQNEEQLEAFFRFWKDSSSPSGGNVIIQKYDDCCGLLPENKPADLAPLERMPCWHLRRDMTILVDGSVPFCKSEGLCSSAGNVFNESVEFVWSRFADVFKQHLKKNYSEKCKVCDEFYTFVF